MMGGILMLQDWLVGLVLLLGAAVELFIVHIALDLPRQVGWVIDAIVLVALLAGVGVAIRAHPLGILIDERNKMSLSRLQMTVWTVIVLTAFAAIGLSRARNDVADPLAVAIPEQLLWAIGITATALVGTLAVRQVKEGANERVPRGSGFAVGPITYNAAPTEARWTDIFAGEETGNEGVADLGKVQMFYFTAIAAIVYAFAVFQLLAGPTSPEGLTGLPVLSEGMIVLLGLSNGAYLVKKALPT
jgi:hypothetical protein